MSRGRGHGSRIPAGRIRSAVGLVALLAAAVPAAAAPPEAAAGDSEEVILGAPAAIDPGAGAQERLVIATGASVRETPDVQAGVLAIVDSEQELAVLEWQGTWARVRYSGLTGWVRTVEPEASDPIDSGAGRAPDPATLERALALLDGPESHPLGPWTLYTDVRVERLLDSLDRVAADTVRAYRELSGLDPGLPPDPGADTGSAPEGTSPSSGARGTAEGGGPAGEEVVVLFARREDHGAFLGEDARFRVDEIGGAAGFGLAVLHREDRTDEELRALLVHELVHLLSRRALGPRTPPWLEEGLADGVAFSRIDRSGRVHLDDLGGSYSRRMEWYRPRHLPRRVVTTSSGPRAAIERLATLIDRRELPSLRTLASMGWSTLVDPRWREMTYAQSAMAVRFFFEGDGGRWRDGFRDYLRAVAAGGADADRPEVLIEALGTDWETLDAAFSRWLRAQAIVNRTF